MNFQNVSITAHATYAETVAMQELEIQRHRMKLSRDRKRVERDPDGFGARLRRTRTNTGWMNDHARSRRLIPAQPLAEWKTGFDRLTRMHGMMPLDALAETVDAQCQSLIPVLTHRHAGMLSDGQGISAGHLSGERKQDLTRAFRSVQSALRQLEDDSTVTSIAHAAHCMAKLRATVNAVRDYESGVSVESFARFAYPDEL